MHRIVLTSLLFISAITLSCCIKEKPLPILGERDFNGKDTVYHTIADFQFLNQDSVLITNETVNGKIYIADFFFTSCRTICPIMKSQMLRIYQDYKNDPEVLILSHTIDPEYDTVGLLRDYAKRLGVTSKKWYFLTGNKDDIYNMASKSYFTTAHEDKNEDQGFIHSGAFLLVDKKQRIRGQYDGTKEAEVDRLLKDIEKLKLED
jgi:protein SCO1